jgi:hypothetical protein
LSKAKPAAQMLCDNFKPIAKVKDIQSSNSERSDLRFEE